MNKRKISKIPTYYMNEISNIIEEMNLYLQNYIKPEKDAETFITKKENLRRFLEICNDIDSGKIGEFEFIPVKHVPEGDIDSQLSGKVLQGFMAMLDGTHFYRSIFIYFFALFEGFLKDFLVEIYKSLPNLMKSSKHASYEQILNNSSISEIKDFLANELVQEIGYKDIDEIRLFFLKKFQVKLEKFGEWESFREDYYIRNIFVHNGGKASDIFVKKVNSSKYKINSPIFIGFKNVKKCSERIIKMIDFISKTLFEKLDVN